MKNNNTIISIVLGVTMLFLAVSFVAWTIIPHYQIRHAYQSFQKAKEGNTEAVLNTSSIFNPYTYAQPQIRNELLEFTFDLYKNKSQFTMDVLPFANEKMREVVDRDATHPKYLLTMAKGYNLHAELTSSSSEYELSNKYYQQALALVPHNPDITYAWGVSLVDQGKIKEGLGLLEDLLKTNPKIADSHYYLGLAYFKLDRYNDALDAFEDALRINVLFEPDITKDVYTKLFEQYYLKKDIQRFVVVTTRLVELDREQGELYKQIVEYVTKRNMLPPINIEKN